MTIGQRIKQRRQQLGLTQEELAHKLGNSSRASICTVEKDREDLTTTRIAKIAVALETSPAYLMGWVEDPSPDYPNTSAGQREQIANQARTIDIMLKRPFDEVLIECGVKPNQLEEAYNFIERFVKMTPDNQKMVENLVKLSQSDS